MEDESRLTKQERKDLKKQEKLTALAHEERHRFWKKIGWYTVIAGIVGIIAYALYQSYVPIPVAEKNKPVDAIAPGDWVKGEATAPVKIIEYSDFQCPSCAKVSPVLDEVLQAYPKQVVLIYRHFPLKEIHFQSEIAAQAAEAAGKQGKFWEMHDKLFTNQDSWAGDRNAQSTFEGYAKDLGLNLNQFKQDIGSKAVRSQVKADYTSGLEQALSSTPSFFINGELTVNPAGLQEFKQVVDLKLQQATASAQVK